MYTLLDKPLEINIKGIKYINLKKDFYRNSEDITEAPCNENTNNCTMKGKI